MEKIIVKNKLFYGLDESTIHHILSCIDHKTLIFNKGEYLYDFSKGFKAGIVLNGRIDLSTIDDDKEIIDRIYEASESFSLNFSSLADRFMVAKKDSKVLVLDVSKIFEKNKSSCSSRPIFMENIIKLYNEQFAYLTYKLDIYSKPKIREKINKYIDKYGKDSLFSNKLSREDLAKFLACNRPALSRELSLMKKEGLI
ncbi:Crp/Fnr family transcriptional regulator [Criibacterium bergeronii]|uniref:Crp/Fnr family transcriptional regulator n=1 Tax=Criibacterium bergeronii TaxID=1871336 RepID=A0A552VEG5_9FIRM|nr:Crp/Fnr family transcriptional regulator [Criibacterium bergeronii]TRW28789.1 Crp/Fnr family transcriptional regulator [Criibacterium bergeronii]